PWRGEILDYVSRLAHFRTSHPALGVNDCQFLHVDFNDNKRVLVWKRGQASQDPVVVVANFSDFATGNALTNPRAEYVVPNWPGTPPGRAWREVTRDRPVRPDQVGREPIFSWEAKVYTTDGRQVLREAPSCGGSPRKEAFARSAKSDWRRGARSAPLTLLRQRPIARTSGKPVAPSSNTYRRLVSTARCIAGPMLPMRRFTKL